jgi:hypothetical protein
MQLIAARLETVRREAYIVDVEDQRYMLFLYINNKGKVFDSSLCDENGLLVADPDLQERITDFVDKVS